MSLLLCTVYRVRVKSLYRSKSNSKSVMMEWLAEYKQAGHHAVHPGIHLIVRPHWPPKRSMSGAEVVAGAETGSVAGAAVAAVAAAAGVAAAEGAGAAAAASADCPSARRASEAPSASAAGAVMQIQIPWPSHQPQKETGRGQQFKATERVQTWCVRRLERIYMLKVKCFWFFCKYRLTHKNDRQRQVESQVGEEKI